MNLYFHRERMEECTLRLFYIYSRNSMIIQMLLRILMVEKASPKAKFLMSLSIGDKQINEIR